MIKNIKSCYLNDTSSSQRSNEFTTVETYHTNNILSKKKDNKIRSKKVVTPPNTLTSNITINKQYRRINDDGIDNYTIETKIISITNKKERNGKRAEYNHRNKVDKSNVQQKSKLQKKKTLIFILIPLIKQSYSRRF